MQHEWICVKKRQYHLFVLILDICFYYMMGSKLFAYVLSACFWFVLKVPVDIAAVFSSSSFSIELEFPSIILFWSTLGNENVRYAIF